MLLDGRGGCGDSRTRPSGSVAGGAQPRNRSITTIGTEPRTSSAMTR